MIAQLKAHATRPQLTPPVVQTETVAAPRPNSRRTENALDSSTRPSEIERPGKRFAMGDDSVSRSD